MHPHRWLVPFWLGLVLCAAGGLPTRAQASGTSDTDAGVVMYGASWCPACANARTFLDQLGVPYVERDIESPSVAAELRALGRARGIPTESIPIFDVAGEGIVGFDRDALLEAVFDHGIGEAARALASPDHATFYMPKTCATECQAMVVELERRGARVTVRQGARDPRARAELLRVLRTSHRPSSEARAPMVVVARRDGRDVVVEASLVRWALRRR